MSSHPMVDLTLSRVNQDALLEKGKRIHDLRLARGGPEIVVPLRTALVRRSALGVRSILLNLCREPRDEIQVSSLDLHYPNRLR